MHIPDGVLSPQVCAVTGALSAGAVGYSLYRLRNELAERTVPMTGMMASLVFAGQMVNFPVPFVGAPVSGHLIGGVLAAAVLGPWGGCLAITLVLIVQCLLFADGGLLALGANVFNMAVIGAWGGYAVLETVRRLLRGSRRGLLAGVIVAAWLSVLAASCSFCIQFWLSPETTGLNFANIFALMALFHSVIGVGEAVITGGVVSFVMLHRPGLLSGTMPSSHEEAGQTESSALGERVGTVSAGSGSGFGRIVAAGLVAAAAVAAFLAPFASQHADGLEAVAEKEFAGLASEEPAMLVLGDYELPSPVAGWKDSPVWRKVSVSLAGLLGVAAVALTAWLLDRGLRRRLRGGLSSHGG